MIQLREGDQKFYFIDAFFHSKKKISSLAVKIIFYLFLNNNNHNKNIYLTLVI